MICRAPVIIFLMVMVSAVDVFSQAEEMPRPKTVELEKRDQTTRRGRILRVERDTAIFETEDGTRERIAMKDIRSVNPIDTLRKRNKWPIPSNRNRYFITSNAYPLRKGEILLSNTYLLFHSVHYGISDKVTIGGGGEIIGRSILYATAKVNLRKRENHSLSANLHLYNFSDGTFELNSGDNFNYLGMLSATSTWGNFNNNFSLGLGYLFYGNTFVPPVVHVAGTTRIAKRFSLITENWFLFVNERTGLPVIVSLGARYIGNRFTLDLGVYNDHQSLFDYYIPYIAFSVRLGR